MPKPLSAGEETFALHCKAHDLKPVREYAFCEGRKWRADFAWPEEKLLVEIEGGVWSGGRHNRGSGFVADLRKYNAAARAGFTVCRYSTEMVLSGEAINDVLNVIGGKGD